MQLILKVKIAVLQQKVKQKSLPLLMKVRLNQQRVIQAVDVIK